VSTPEIHSRPAQHAGESTAAEYRALTERAGFALLEDRMVVRVTGDDRAQFFHGMCTANVKAAKPGEILPALFLTEHAHVIGEAFIWVEPDALTLETGLAQWPREKEQLEKLLVADDVEMEEMRPLAVLHVEGPNAADALASAGISGAHSLQPWHCSKSINAMLGRVARFGADAFSILGDRTALNEIGNQLVEAGATRVSEAALEVVRVEHGVARVGVDTSAKTIALEARLERSISFDKGCYLGQETVERATARGGLKKKLFGLRSKRTLKPGAALTLDGKEVGQVTTSVVSPRMGTLGLAILHHSAWTPGATLIAHDGGGETEAVVCEIPFQKPPQ
jgi:folate-binding protein YgfZ